MTRLALLPVLAVLAAFTLAPSAAGSHPAFFCDGIPNGGLASNQKVFLLFYWINWSYWTSDRDYPSRFAKTPSGMRPTISLCQETPASTRQTTPNGLDLYRRTGIQRAGYGFAQYGMSEYSHGGCVHD